MLALASAAGAQQAIDHSHMHDTAAVAQAPTQQPAAPQPPAPGQPPAAPGGGGGRGGPQIEVPWNDAIPPGTADHAMRALKESSRHGEWADIKMADGVVLKSWVVYPERAQKAGVVLVIHDIRGMSDMARAMGDQLAQDGFIADRARLPVREGPERRRDRIARQRRRQDDPGPDPGRRHRAG